MGDDRVKVTVNIMGSQYTMVGQEPEEYLQGIALYVDKKIRELHKRNSVLNNVMLAILTALNITDEYFKLQKEYEMLKKEASKPEKELEDARYQLRKSKEEIARLNNEIESLRQQLGNSQEEASNIYDEWLKAQKETKELRGKIDFLVEQNRELEMKLGIARSGDIKSW